MVELEAVADGRDHLGLLDGVDAQVCLELVVEAQLLRRVAGDVRDDLEDAIRHHARGLTGLVGLADRLCLPRPQ